jgi:hypothetical protein
MLMSEMRKSPRFATSARARSPDVLEGDNLLKNLSITGCCLECTGFSGIKLNTVYKVLIEPETASRIEEFELQAECKWIHKGDYSSEIGFQITASPTGKYFQRYVDYLSYQSSGA